MTAPIPDINLILIGLRGCGKTTVGRIVADQLNRPFIDTDVCVVQSADMTISQIFATEGEAGFRARESLTIAEVSTRRNVVISLGGGAVLDPANLQRFKNSSHIIWLTGSADTLHERIQADYHSPSGRPALTDLDPLDEIRKMLGNRTPIYQQWANDEIPTDGRTPQDVARNIVRSIQTAQSANPHPPTND
jgi:shikimate kinase